MVPTDWGEGVPLKHLSSSFSILCMGSPRPADLLPSLQPLGDFSLLPRSAGLCPVCVDFHLAVLGRNRPVFKVCASFPCQGQVPGILISLLLMCAACSWKEGSLHSTEWLSGTGLAASFSPALVWFCRDTTIFFPSSCVNTPPKHFTLRAFPTL